MPLYKYVIEEHNGEQEYRQEMYIIAPNTETVASIAAKVALEWYGDDGKEDGDGWKIGYGGPWWIFDAKSIEEVHELVVLDVEKKVDVHIPLVLPPADLVVQEYLKVDGCHCPKCKSYNIEGEFAEIDSGEAWQHIVCNDCGAEWNDIYKLVGMELEG